MEAGAANASRPDSGVVLVADDDPTLRLIAQQMLAQDGYKVILAQDGREACRLFDIWTPDLVLMDARMPVLDGFDACAQLRRRQDTDGTPVVMITGWGDPEAVERAFDSGATDLRLKPLDWSIVRQSVRSLLAGDRSANTLSRRVRESLTGLPTRERVQGQLNRAIANAEETGQTLALVFLDLVVNLIAEAKGTPDAVGPRQGAIAAPATDVSTRLRREAPAVQRYPRWVRERLVMTPVLQQMSVFLALSCVAYSAGFILSWFLAS